MKVTPSLAISNEPYVITVIAVRKKEVRIILFLPHLLSV